MADLERTYLQKSIGEYVGQFYSHDYTIEMANVLRDSLSTGQLLSKVKVVDIFSESTIRTLLPAKDQMNICFVGHWHGLLPRMLHNANKIDSARGIELDPFWVNFSNRLNYDWEWQSQSADAGTVDLSNYNVIVNTSCEHMSTKWVETVSPGTILIIQSTNYCHPTHSNTVNSVNELAEQYVTGNRQLIGFDTSKYDVYSRYTIITT